MQNIYLVIYWFLFICYLFIHIFIYHFMVRAFIFINVYLRVRPFSSVFWKSWNWSFNVKLNQTALPSHTHPQALGFRQSIPPQVVQALGATCPGRADHPSPQYCKCLSCKVHPDAKTIKCNKATIGKTTLNNASLRTNCACASHCCQSTACFKIFKEFGQCSRMFQTQISWPSWPKHCVTVTGALLSFLPGPIAIESSSMDWYTSFTMVLSAQWIFECSDHFRYTSGTKVPEGSPANSWKANLMDYVPASIWMHRTSQNYRVLANFCEQQGTSREQRWEAPAW